MKKLILLNTFIICLLSQSYGQKILKGKEIGIDMRHFNSSGNFSFLVRKPSSDSSVLKRRNYGFSFQSSTNFPSFEGVNSNDIPVEFKTATNNNAFINFSWGKEKYIKLNDFDAKKLMFYHSLLKNVSFQNQSAKTALPTTDPFNGLLLFVQKNSTTNNVLGFGLTLLGGLKYSLTQKISLGVESAITAGISLSANSQSSKTYFVWDKTTNESPISASISTNISLRPQIINALWFSYKF